MKYYLLIILILGVSSQTENERKVWDYLIKEGLSKSGVACLMGNLKAESGIESVIYDNSCKSQIGLTDQEYVDQVNNGIYPEILFIYDGVGFGLAQWSYYTRKQALMNHCRGRIGNMDCQLEYLVAELKMYFTSLYKELKSTNDIRTCTNKVLYNYEISAYTISEQNIRYNYAQNYYDMFALE